MSLSGSTLTMPLIDILDWLGRAKKTGLLVVENQNFTTKIYISKGQIISSSSTDPRSFFGQFILSHTNVTEENLRTALEIQEKSRVNVGKGITIKTLLGKILVDEKHLTGEEVQDLLRKKTEETIYTIFLWRQANFSFWDEEMPPDELVPLSMDIGEIIAKAQKMLSEWEDVRKEFHSHALTFQVLRQTIPKGYPLSRLEQRILAIAEEEKTVPEISMHLHCTEYMVNRVLYKFFKMGAVKIVEPLHEAEPAEAQEAQEDSLVELVKKSQSSYESGNYEDTIVYTRKVLSRDPENKEAREILKDSEQKYSAGVFENAYARTDVPYLKKSLDFLIQQNFSAPEKFILSRINGTWDIHTLVKICPMKECDTLQTFKSLIENDIIGLNPGAGHPQ